MTAQRFKGISNYGVADFGHTVTVDLGMEDGTTLKLACGHEALPKLVVSLRTVAEAAEKMRRTQPGHPIDLQQTYKAHGSRTGVGPDGSIVVQFATNEGPPILIQMPQQLARDTIERLRTALTDTAKKTPGGN